MARELPALQEPAAPPLVRQTPYRPCQPGPTVGPALIFVLTFMDISPFPLTKTGFQQSRESIFG